MIISSDPQLVFATQMNFLQGNLGISLRPSRSQCTHPRWKAPQNPFPGKYCGFGRHHAASWHHVSDLPVLPALSRYPSQPQYSSYQLSAIWLQQHRTKQWGVRSLGQTLHYSVSPRLLTAHCLVWSCIMFGPQTSILPISLWCQNPALVFCFFFGLFGSLCFLTTQRFYPSTALTVSLP